MPVFSDLVLTPARLLSRPVLLTPAVDTCVGPREAQQADLLAAIQGFSLGLGTFSIIWANNYTEPN